MAHSAARLLQDQTSLLHSCRHAQRSMRWGAVAVEQPRGRLRISARISSLYRMYGRIPPGEGEIIDTVGATGMRARKWGLIAAGALVLAIVVLAVDLIRPGDPEAEGAATAAVSDEPTLTRAPSRAPTSTPDAPLTYTVRAGDTLSAIAQEHDVSMDALAAANDLPDPDVLQIGQVLIVPETEPAAPALETEVSTAFPSVEPEEEDAILPPTLTPSGPPVVEISDTQGLGDLAAESLTLKNTGGTVSLENWILSDSTDDRFVLPALTLFPDGEVRVFSSGGDDTPRELYWNRTEPAWEPGELVTLRDEKGNVVDTLIVPE